MLRHSLMLGWTQWEGEAPAEPEVPCRSVVRAAQQELRPPEAIPVSCCDKALGIRCEMGAGIQHRSGPVEAVT